MTDSTTTEGSTLDQFLNTLFGLIGVIGFGFAIWQWRQSEKIRDLFERTLEAIAQNAGDFAQATDTMGGRIFARQVQRQCYALVRTESRMSRYFVRFYPAEESSSWQTSLGERKTQTVEKTGTSLYRLVLSGTAAVDGTDKLIYGPYETLPMAGTYRVRLNLSVTPPEGATEDTLILRLDVNGSNQQLSERFYSTKDVIGTEKSYELVFRYKDTSEKLEYRVALLKKGTSATVYDVTVERIGR
jgi:hypothetical protein